MNRRIGNRSRGVVGQDYYGERSARMKEHFPSRLSGESVASDWRYVPVPGARTKWEITRPRIPDCIRKCTQVHLTAQRSSWNAYISIKDQLTWIFVCMLAFHWTELPTNNMLHFAIDIFAIIDPGETALFEFVFCSIDEKHMFRPRTKASESRWELVRLFLTSVGESDNRVIWARRVAGDRVCLNVYHRKMIKSIHN